MSHPNEITGKCQLKTYDHYIMVNHAQEMHVTGSTHDRKSTWQKVRQWTTTWLREEDRPDEHFIRKVLEAEETNQSQRTPTKSHQSDTWNEEMITKLRKNAQLQYCCKREAKINYRADRAGIREWNLAPVTKQTAQAFGSQRAKLCHCVWWTYGLSGLISDKRNCV